MHIHKFMGSWAGWAARLGWATQLGLMGCSANQMWLAYSAALLFDWDTTLKVRIKGESDFRFWVSLFALG